MCPFVWKCYWIIILAWQIYNITLSYCSCPWMWFLRLSWPTIYICTHRRVSMSPSLLQLPLWHWCMSGCTIDLMELDLQDLFLQRIDVSPPVVCSVEPWQLADSMNALMCLCFTHWSSCMSARSTQHSWQGKRWRMQTTLCPRSGQDGVVLWSVNRGNSQPDWNLRKKQICSSHKLQTT